MKIFKATAILLLQLSIASANPNTPPTHGLVAHYPLNGNTIDIIAGNNGAMYGSTPFGATYATFNGIDDYIEIPAANQFLENKVEWTISYWIRVNDTSRVHSFLSKRDYCSFENGFDMRGRSTINFENLKLTQHKALHSPIWINEGWELITVVKSGNKYTIYADGTQQNVKTFTGSTFKSGDLSISNSPCITSTDGTERLIGDVDDLRIYNRALHSREILKLHRTTHPDRQKPLVYNSVAATPTPTKMGMGTNNNSNKNDPTVTIGDIIFSKDGKSWRFKTKDDK